MEILNQINQIILLIADPLLNWLLNFDKNLVIAIVAIFTATVITIMRKFTSNQDLLKRCDDDKIVLTKRIKQIKKEDNSNEVNSCTDSLLKTIKSNGLQFPNDGVAKLQNLLSSAWKKSEVKRLGMIKNQISMKTLKQEGLPLLAALIPLAILGSWCFCRIGFYPPVENETVTIAAHFPITDVGKIVHLTPQKGMTIENGSVEQVAEAELTGIKYGRVEWKVNALSNEKPYKIVIRYNENDKYEHELLVGQNTYSEQLKLIDDIGERAIEILMPEVKFFGIIPGFWLFAPWLIAYLMITIPFVPLLKKVLKIY